MTEREVDETTGVSTTGHEWDGIKELDYPMPRWWLWTFYATIVFSIGYVIYYPAIPLLEGSTMGVSGETTRSSLKQELELADKAKQDIVLKIANTDLEDIRNDAELARFAIAGGKSAFKVYCSQCHGSGASGSAGFPNLNDDDWLWGGDLESIYISINHGVRNDEDEDARISDMPAFGADELLEKDQIKAVTEYVLKVSSQEYDTQLASSGETIFADNCAGCHGDNAAGNRDVGAPNLQDAISLYGNTRRTIYAQIIKPQHGVMPSWGTRLGEATVKQLTLYVHSLGGGERAAD